MTEGSSAVKTKRTGARFFKNPPQPHMCIRDSLKGSQDPCYVNVLSWDKVALGVSSEGVPLYGGMKVCPPRSEKKEVAVFAVMANPEILKLHGKNARNPTERSWLIDILLDFVEKMNDGVVFNRRYTVLRDRDITGELKEIWMVVQSERAKAQQSTGSDELRRPVPQYPHYQEQQQHHHHPQQQQEHHQHPPPQQQHVQHPHEEHTQQPPQYHSSVYYAQESSENCESYELSCGRQNMIISTKKKFRHYDSSASRIDRYIFREPIVLQNPQIPQQNCLNYPAYQYQQLPRPMGAPFPPNIHPNATLNCPSPHSGNPMNLIRPEPPMQYNKLPIDKFYETFHRMPPSMQPPQPQIALGPPSGYYEAQNSPPPNFLRMLRPQEPQETARRPPSHVTRTKPIIMVDERDALVVPPPPPPEEVAATIESSGARVPPLQHQHFAAVSTNVSSPPMILPMTITLPRDQNPKKPSTINFLKLFRPQEVDSSRKDVNHVAEANIVDTNENQNCTEDNSREFSGPRNSQQLVGNLARDQNSKKPGKPKIKFLKRNISVRDRKSLVRDAESLINGDVERLNESEMKDRTSGKDADVEDRLNKIIPESERNGNADKPRTDSSRITKTTTSLRNTLKILAGAGSADEAGNKKKINGQVKSQGGKDNGEEVLQVYTILRKPEATTSQEDVTRDMAQLSIKDCGETTSVVSAVLS